jgi:uncharacterized membrane protein YphA (DoxX/SURF4 family)
MPANSKLPGVGAGGVIVILRIAVGALFGTTFFENLWKGLYTPAGYASLIHYYIQYGHAPAIWKAVMGSAAASAAVSGPMQAMLESSLAILLIIGLFTRPAALVAFAFLTSLWISEWGIGWYWELLMPMIVALSLALGPSGGYMAVDVALARRWPRLSFLAT